MERYVKCNKCGFVGLESDFGQNHDFCQRVFVSRCPKCDNHQTPGDASMRVFGGQRPFEYIDRIAPPKGDALAKVLYNGDEAS